MHKVITLLTIAAVLLLGGCAISGNGGLGAETGPDRLPDNMTLLESDEALCEGTVHVGEETVANRGPRNEYFVDPGENATFRLGRGPVEWACITRNDRDFGRHACPQRASYVRFTRAAQGNDLLLECFG